MNNRVSVYAGSILLAFGLLFLINAFIPNSWALILVGIGLVIVSMGWVFRVGALLPSGVTLTGLGLILLAQSLTGQWQSWLYVWPLIIAFNMLGLLLADGMGSRGADHPALRHSGLRRSAVRRTALTWLALSVATTLVFYLLYLRIPGGELWSLIPVGVGVMFLAAALLQSLPGLLIPGAIIAGIGALLHYQNLTGDWGSWAYAWALVPAFVGLGLLLAGIFARKRGLRIVGLYFLVISLVVFAMLAAAFGRGADVLAYSPVLLIALGLFLLIDSLARRRPA